MAGFMAAQKTKGLCLATVQISGAKAACEVAAEKGAVKPRPYKNRSYGGC